MAADGIGSGPSTSSSPRVSTTPKRVGIVVDQGVQNSSGQAHRRMCHTGLVERPKHGDQIPSLDRSSHPSNSLG